MASVYMESSKSMPAAILNPYSSISGCPASQKNESCLQSLGKARIFSVRHSCQVPEHAKAL